MTTTAKIKKSIGTLKVTSNAFANNTLIPSKYTCDGENINPPLNIDHLPKEAKSLALTLVDPDAPNKTWVHWIVWNIPPENQIKEKNRMGTEGMNDFMQCNYGGPCPPGGTHHYHFKVYALDQMLELDPGASIHKLEKAMSQHIIAGGELVGLYKRLS